MGNSDCSMVITLNCTGCPLLVPSTNTYFICGPSAYTWCSRQPTAPAPTREKSGTESRFPHHCNKRESIGSRGGRIPEPLRGYQDYADAQTGNPDIRVPEIINTDEGLSGERVPNTEDAGGGQNRDEDENGEDDEQRRTTNSKPCSVKDAATKKENAENREFRHVPGGTWLHQVRSF
ncbi:hypothetical protein NDU88_001318 [Pleurodeles waltl]|uniref:Uncharacterized protein n=1 Tax=Pleurodeles waltl TaxID=8319 RepID=A0AAV7UTZ5_PLEWA|nr:hypothetical protein NDU88_001318 [Pleurodeles waltl]